MEFIDLETGEIIGADEAYETVPVDFGVLFKNVKFNSSPNNSNCSEMLKEHCLSIGEKEIYEPYSKLSLYKETLKKDYSVVVSLIKHIKHRNIVFMSISELCVVFGLSDNKHLDRKLKQLTKRNIIQYTKVNRSNYKVFVNPNLFYRGDSNIYNSLCSKPEWIIDGKPSKQPELFKTVVFDTNNIVCEAVYEEQDSHVKTLINNIGYTDSENYCADVNKNRINMVLNCNMQKFITNYLN